MWELSHHFRTDSGALASLNKLIHALQEMNKFHTTLLDQASRTILKSITAYLRNDVQSNVHDARNLFERVSAEHDAALARSAGLPAPRASKTQSIAAAEALEEADNLLVATGSCFGHQALGYVGAMAGAQSRKRHEILSSVCVKATNM